MTINPYNPISSRLMIPKIGTDPITRTHQWYFDHLCPNYYETLQTHYRHTTDRWDVLPIKWHLISNTDTQTSNELDMISCTLDVRHLQSDVNAQHIRPGNLRHQKSDIRHSIGLENIIYYKLDIKRHQTYKWKQT